MLHLLPMLPMLPCQLSTRLSLRRCCSLLCRRIVSTLSTFIAAGFGVHSVGDVEAADVHNSAWSLRRVSKTNPVSSLLEAPYVATGKEMILGFNPSRIFD